MTQETIDRHHQLCEETKAKFQTAGVKGPWDTEPNRVEFKHAGLDCLLVRHGTMLHWCGYVGVKPGHPCFEKSYQEVEGWSSAGAKPCVPDLEVHGGLTFSDKCDGFICHVTDDPEDKTWWLGFDCNHAWDISPGMEYASFLSDLPTFGHGAYRDIDYVMAETRRLAEQLAKVG